MYDVLPPQKEGDPSQPSVVVVERVDVVLSILFPATIGLLFVAVEWTGNT
jgi:hypothetical protein